MSMARRRGTPRDQRDPSLEVPPAPAPEPLPAPAPEPLPAPAPELPPQPLPPPTKPDFVEAPPQTQKKKPRGRAPRDEKRDDRTPGDAACGGRKGPL